MPKISKIYNSRFIKAFELSKETKASAIIDTVTTEVFGNDFAEKLVARLIFADGSERELVMNQRNSQRMRRRARRRYRYLGRLRGRLVGGRCQLPRRNRRLDPNGSSAPRCWVHRHRHRRPAKSSMTRSRSRARCLAVRPRQVPARRSSARLTAGGRTS
jgi:hypothetical protein